MCFLPESGSVFRFSEGFSVPSEGLPEDAGVVLPRPSRFPAGRRGREGAGGKGSVPYPDGAPYRKPRGAGGPLGRAVTGGSSCRPGLSGCRVPAGRPDASARGAKADPGRRTAYICLRFIFRGVFQVRHGTGRLGYVVCPLFFTSVLVRISCKGRNMPGLRVFIPPRSGWEARVPGRKRQ